MSRLFAPSDLTQALALFTRLPRLPALPAPEEGRSLAQTAWAWPLIGALIGLITALAMLAALALDLPPLLAAVLALMAQLALTGALHEDGLADCADGFWGAQERVRRLEIMHDSRIGTYGMAALTLTLLARASALASLAEAGWLAAPLIATGALSRVPMALISALLPPARDSGLSHGAGRPLRATWQMALGLAALIGVLATGLGATLIASLWIAATGFGLARLAQRKIAGQTGDVLGASQQLAEIAALATFAALAG